MSIFNNNDQEGLRWRLMLVLSLFMHGVLFSAFFWVPGHTSGGLKVNEVAYEVTLMDSSKINMPGESKSTPAVKQSDKNTSAADSRQARRISSGSSKKNSVNLSKRTVDKNRSKPKKDDLSSDQLLNKAISKLEKKTTSENNADYLDKAIAELNKKVDSSGGGNAGGTLSENSLAMNMYKMKVETSIKSQWSYSDALGNYEAIVIVKIRKDGTVLETSFIKPSGNKIFDESVLKAIEKARPLPPLPEEYRENYEEIKITFNLNDL